MSIGNNIKQRFPVLRKIPPPIHHLLVTVLCGLVGLLFGGFFWGALAGAVAYSVRELLQPVSRWIDVVGPWAVVTAGWLLR